MLSHRPQDIQEHIKSLEKKVLPVFWAKKVSMLIDPHPPLFLYSQSNQGQTSSSRSKRGTRSTPSTRKPPGPRIYPIQQDTILTRMITKTNTRNDRPYKPVSASYTTIAVHMLPS